MKKYKFKINNLDCPNCANELERVLQNVDNIQNVSISFITQKLTFESLEENEKETINQIKKVIKKEEPDVTIEEL